MHLIAFSKQFYDQLLIFIWINFIDPLIEKVSKANDVQYDDDTDKGNTYMMDYILNELPKPEFNNLCKQIESGKTNFKTYYSTKRNKSQKMCSKSLTTADIFEQFLEKMEYIDENNLGLDWKKRIIDTVGF